MVTSFICLLIDIWDTYSDKDVKSGAILSFDAVCMGSPVIIMLQKKQKNKH